MENSSKEGKRSFTTIFLSNLNIKYYNIPIEIKAEEMENATSLTGKECASTEVEATNQAWEGEEDLFSHFRKRNAFAFAQNKVHKYH